MHREGRGDGHRWQGLGAALGKNQREIALSGVTCRHPAEASDLASAPQLQKKTGPAPLVVSYPDPRQYRGVGVDLFRQGQVRVEVFEVVVSQPAGKTHEAEQDRDHQVEQVVAGVDGGKTEEKGEQDVEGARGGEPQAKARGSWAAHDLSPPRYGNVLKDGA